MHKWLFIGVLAGAVFNTLAERLPNCTSAQAEAVIKKIKTDKAFNHVIHEKKTLIKQYPKVKNCSAAQYAECRMGSRYWEICDSVNCKFTLAQEAKLDLAVIEQIDKEFSEYDLRLTWDYLNECFPEGRIYCNVSTAKNRGNLKQMQPT